MALALVAWMSLQIGSEPAPQMAMQQQSASLRPANYAVNRSMNPYLMAHQEFSPSADVRGGVAYIRTVADQ
jgi:sigma-E factor negative regulatory protein RseA